MKRIVLFCLLVLCASLLTSCDEQGDQFDKGFLETLETAQADGGSDPPCSKNQSCD